MYRLSIQTNISAAHLIRGYKGPCARLHGHNWKLKVDVTASVLNEIGMAIDFKDLKEITWKIAGRYDHQNFNEIAPFDKINPTAENVAKYFFEEIDRLLPEGIKMAKISLWETEKYLVEYSEK